MAGLRDAQKVANHPSGNRADSEIDRAPADSVYR